MESIPTTEVSMSTIDQEMVLAHFIVSDDVERSRRFEEAHDRDALLHP
jgi:hypothetical protein